MLAQCLPLFDKFKVNIVLLFSIICFDEHQVPSRVIKTSPTVFAHQPEFLEPPSTKIFSFLHLRSRTFLLFPYLNQYFRNNPCALNVLPFPHFHASHEFTISPSFMSSWTYFKVLSFKLHCTMCCSFSFTEKDKSHEVSNLDNNVDGPILLSVLSKLSAGALPWWRSQ